jgi:hypothetical protein
MGIRTTPNSLYALDVRGKIFTKGILNDSTFYQNVENNEFTLYDDFYNDTTFTVKRNIARFGTEVYEVNVGINVINPIYPLHVNGGAFIANTLVAGNDLDFSKAGTRTLKIQRETAANAAGSILNIQSGSATSGATDKDAGMLTISPGISTGTGKSSVRIQAITRANSTGSTDNTLVDRVIIPSRKYLTDTIAVGIFEVALGSNQTTGGQINYTIHCTNGVDYQAHSGIVLWGAVSKSTTITSAVSHASAASGLEFDVVSGGTITDTWAVTNGSGKITITINANSSLATPVIWIEYTITNNGSTAITQL